MTAPPPEEDWTLLEQDMRAWLDRFHRLAKSAAERAAAPDSGPSDSGPSEAGRAELATLSEIAEAQRRMLEETAAALARERQARAITALLAAGLVARGGADPAWAALVQAAPEFDPGWYLAQIPALTPVLAPALTPTVGPDPLAHFLTTGAIELRDPGPSFSSLGYHLANPDVAAAGLPALIHWQLYGRAEGRTGG